MAGNRLGSLERGDISAVAGVSRVVVLVAFELRVALGIAGAFLRRLGDVHAFREVLADPRVRRGHEAIGSAERPGVSKQHVAEEVASLEQRRRRDPRPSAGPARDVRWIEERLPEAGGEAAEVRNRRELVQSHLPVGRYDQHDWALDLRGDGPRTVEVSGQENAFEQRLDLVTARAERAAELGADGGRNFV